MKEITGIQQTRRYVPVEKVVVPTPDITFQLLDGTHVAAHADELQALHAAGIRRPTVRSQRRCWPVRGPFPGPAPPAGLCPG
jgi:hypothetical protein